MLILECLRRWLNIINYLWILGVFWPMSGVASDTGKVSPTIVA